MLAVGGEADTGDEAHVTVSNYSSFRDAPLGAGPESITPNRGYGFRAPAFVAPRHDEGISGSHLPPPSIRRRQAPHLLGNKTENELRADRGDARDQRLPQVALDVVF